MHNREQDVKDFIRLSKNNYSFEKPRLSLSLDGEVGCVVEELVSCEHSLNLLHTPHSYLKPRIMRC